MTTLRQALEQALLADPDDRAAQLAYADHLAEEGDPRGEFIQVQLALEVPELPSERYRELRQREAELLRRHEQEWLGPEITQLFALHRQRPWAEQRSRPLIRYRWHRGWLDTLEVRELTWDLADELRSLPAARFLRRLVIEQEAPLVPALESAPLVPLLDGPFLDSLRVFQLGPAAQASSSFLNAPDGLVPVLAATPRLRELRLYARAFPSDWWPGWVLPELTDLEVLNTPSVRLAPIATGPPRPHLTRLGCVGVGSFQWRPQLDLDDFRAFLEGTALPALEELCLAGTYLGDEGVELITRSPLVRRLKCLDLRHCRLSQANINALRACGIEDLRVSSPAR